MLKIMLVCSAGMSTSLLVTKMEKAAAEKKIDCKIWAVSESTVPKELGSFDILLLGPQVRFKKNEMIRIVNNPEIPIEVIDMKHYGMMDGVSVLNTALKLANK